MVKILIIREKHSKLTENFCSVNLTLATKQDFFSCFYYFYCYFFLIFYFVSFALLLVIKISHTIKRQYIIDFFHEATFLTFLWILVLQYPRKVFTFNFIIWIEVFISAILWPKSLNQLSKRESSESCFSVSLEKVVWELFLAISVWTPVFVCGGRNGSNKNFSFSASFRALERFCTLFFKIIKAVARVLVSARIILKFAAPVVFKIRNSKIYS